MSERITPERLAEFEGLASIKTERYNTPDRTYFLEALDRLVAERAHAEAVEAERDAALAAKERAEAELAEIKAGYEHDYKDTFASETEELDYLRKLRGYKDLALKMELANMETTLSPTLGMKFVIMTHCVNGFHWATIQANGGFFEEISTPHRPTRNEMESDLDNFRLLFGGSLR